MVLNRAFKFFVYRLCYVSRYHSKLLQHIEQNNLVSILSLHRISPARDLFWPPLSPNVFDQLLNFLKKHFEIVTLHEINQVSQKPKLVLSFDDGYYDFIEYAMPILKKHQVKANLNIIPSQLLNEKPLWNIMLYDFLNAAPPALIKQIKFPGFDANDKKINKIKFGLQISRALKKFSFSERDNIIHQLEKNIFSKCDYPKTRMIQLNEMSSVMTEHEIGVHSYSHNSMGNESLAYFIDDFKKCQQFFRDNHFPELDIYAFPNGSYRKEQIDYLKSNGVKHILLVDDQYANAQSPHARFNIGAFNQYEAIFQALGIKYSRKANEYSTN